MKLFQHLTPVFKNRRLQVDIVTIFMILLAATTLFIITFSNSRTHDSILKFSKGTIQRSSQIILEKVDNLIKEFEKIPQNASSLILEASQINPLNSALMGFMQEQVKLYPNLYAFYIGTTDGGLIEITNLKVSKQTHLLSNPSTPLPQGCLYSLRLIDRSTAIAKQTCLYYDQAFNQIFEETIHPVTFDARTRPWYQASQQSSGIFWTSIYTYDPIEEPGITVSYPLFDRNKNFIGVAGADLSLTTFSQFLQNLKIGVNGKAYILNSATGKLLLPLEAQNSPLIEDVYAQYKKSHEQDSLFESNKISYLTALNNFSLGINHSWLVTVIAPLSDFFKDVLATQKIILIISTLSFVIASIFVVIFSRRISNPITILATEIDRIKQLNLDSTTRVMSNIKELTILDNSIDAMRSALRSFAKYVPKEIVRQLINQGVDICLGGEKKELAVLFSDIENFTPLAEKLPADELMSLLEQYFDPLSQIILNQEGTIDKYIGDSIMAFWGAPKQISDPCYKACTSALLGHHFLNSFNEKREANNLPPFPTRFGIDTGVAIVGNIGTQERINYTALGDVINTASRLQGINKIYHTSIIITHSVYIHLNNRFVVRPLDLVTIKGKQKKIKIYELIGLNTNDPKIGATQEQKTFATLFTKSYELYELGHYQEALTLFKELNQKYPHDEPTQLLIKRLEKT